MELFRVGGHVPDTNYLFMGEGRIGQSASASLLTMLQETLSIEDSTRSSRFFSYYASRCAILIESRSSEEIMNRGKSRPCTDFMMNACGNTAARTFGGTFSNVRVKRAIIAPANMGGRESLVGIAATCLII